MTSVDAAASRMDDTCPHGANAKGSVTGIQEMSRDRHAWLIFFILGILSVIAAPINLMGHPPDPPSPSNLTGLSSTEIAARIPGIAGYIGSISTQLGNFMLATGLLLAAVAIGPFRRGEKWAWYAAWTAPLLLLIQLVNSRGGNGWQFDLGFLIATVAGLVWPFRLFFPEAQKGGQRNDID